MFVRSKFQPRYHALDVYRGLASVAVFLNHIWPHAPVFRFFWLGVQIFFVISGYCITAAIERAIERRYTLGTFMKRRMRRIGPPYLASFALLLVVHVLMRLPKGVDVALGYLDKPWFLYVQNATLTQWLTIPWLNHHEVFLPSAHKNPSLLLMSYWSLNYEEQFYAIAAVVVLVSHRIRPLVALATLTVGTGLYNLITPGFISGFFLDYWLQFAIGAFVYVRLCRTTSVAAARAMDAGFVASFAFVLAMALHRGEFDDLMVDRYAFYAQLVVCMAFASVLLLQRPYDGVGLETRIGRVALGAGAMSYSLYLFHHSLMELFDLLTSPLGGPWPSPLRELAMFGFVMALAYLLYRLVERPFLNTPPSAVPPPDNRAIAPS